MNSESLRIADQITLAFSGDAWHGPPLGDLLAGITAVQASARLISPVHSIWELVVHIDLYVHAASEAIRGIPMPHWYGTEQDWPPLTTTTSEAAWQEVKDSLFQHAADLASYVRELQDSRLLDIVPGREYNFYHLLHGIVQHSLYHGGQIAILKKAAVTQYDVPETGRA